MLLNEILTKTTFPQSRRPIQVAHGDAFINKFFDYVGHGFQTYVMSQSKRPDRVVKVCQVVGVGDPVYQFTRMCSSSKNPFFPKILFAKYYDYATIYDSEKLAEFWIHSQNMNTPKRKIYRTLLHRNLDLLGY